MTTFLYFLIFYWIFAHLLIFTTFLYLNKDKVTSISLRFLYFTVFFFIGGILLPLLLGAHLGYLINKIN